MYYYAAPKSPRALKGLCAWCTGVFEHIEKFSGCCFSSLSESFLRLSLSMVDMMSMRFTAPCFLMSFLEYTVRYILFALFIWRTFFFYFCPFYLENFLLLFLPLLTSSPTFSLFLLCGIPASWALVLLNWSNDFHISHPHPHPPFPCIYSIYATF